MKLTDICSNERFVKGELYVSENKLRWLKLNEGIFCNCNDLGEFKFNFYSNFCINDFISCDWKLYELIDGKMVELNYSEFPNSSK